MRTIVTKIITSTIIVASCLFIVYHFINPKVATLIVSPFINVDEFTESKVDMNPVLNEIIKTPYNGFEKPNKFIITIDGSEYLCKYYQDSEDLLMFNGTDLNMSRGIINNPVTGQKDVARKIHVNIYERHNDKTEENPLIRKEYALVPNEEWYTIVPFTDYEKSELALEAQQKEDKDKKVKEIKEQQEKDADKQIHRVN